MSIIGSRFVSVPGRRNFPAMVSPVKRQASTRGPLFILWSHTPPLGHRSWGNPRIMVRARAGVSDQFYRPAGAPGAPAELETGVYLSGRYNQRNDATDMPDITAQEKRDKMRAVSRWIARRYCDVAFWQGLTRGSGNQDGGAAGGILDFGEEVTYSYFGGPSGDGNAAIARFFLGLMFDPRDACNRTATVRTAAGTRTIRLPLRGMTGQIPPGYSETTPAGAAALDALTPAQQDLVGTPPIQGVRHTGYFTLWTRNGVAECRTFCQMLAEEVTALCDSYMPYAGQGSGRPVRICTPTLLLPSLEQQFFRLCAPNAAFKAASNGWSSDLYLQIGNFWNAREDPRFATEPIYKTADASGNYTIPVTMRDAMLADPDLAPLVTALAPVETANATMTAAQLYAFDRLNYNAISHALAEAVAPLKEAFGLMRDANYGLVRVPDKNTPYITVGGGLLGTQDVLRQDLQAPSCYGRTTNTAAIRAAGTQAELDAAVAAWDAANLADCEAVLDSLDTEREVAPFVYGVVDPALVRDGTLAQFGGSSKFFGDLVERLFERGCTTFQIFAGDLDRTVAAVEAVCTRNRWE